MIFLPLLLYFDKFFNNKINIAQLLFILVFSLEKV